MKKFLEQEFKQHHAFYLVIFSILVIFSLNIWLYASLQNTVSVSADNSAEQNPIILTTNDVVETGQDDLEEPINSLESLKPILKNYTKDLPTTGAVYLMDLQTNNFIGINEEVTFKSASMYKLFVAFETLKRVDSGQLSLSQATGYDAGSKSIESCLEIMINVSDNPCGRALRKVLNVTENPLPSLAEEGFISTNLNYDYPTTSSRDIGLLFEKIYKNTSLSDELNDKFIGWLKAQQVTNRIPQGLPAGTEIAHKTGDLEGFSHDGGIIYTEFGDYILVIMGGPWANGYSDAPAYMIELTEAIYNELSQLNASNP